MIASASSVTPASGPVGSFVTIAGAQFGDHEGRVIFPGGSDGEVVWWGHWLVAAATPIGRWTVLSPALMTFFLRRVSGVTLLESTMSKRPGYREYVERTSPFLPRPPRGTGGA